MNVFLGDFLALRGNAANDRTCPIRVAVHMSSPITVPDYRPGPNLPNPLSPCNQPPCSRCKSRQAKLGANRAAGFEAARVHALFSSVGYGHQAGSQRVSAILGSSRRVSWPQVASHTVTAARARAVGTGARLFAGRVKIRLTLSSSGVHPPWPCRFVWGQVRMGQVRMIRRAAFDPPSRQSRGHKGHDRVPIKVLLSRAGTDVIHV